MRNTLQTINDLALNNPKELVDRAERHYERELAEVAARIADNDDIKIVALAGPSASGKTTTAHILCEKLKALGEETEIISLDDFYLPVDELPILEDGTRDISVHISDNYDYTKIWTSMDGKEFSPSRISLGTIANDMGTITSKIDAINPYKVDIYFTIRR